MIVLLGWLKVDANLTKVAIVDHPVEIAVNQNTNCAYVADDETKLSVIDGAKGTIVAKVEVGEDGLDIGYKGKYTRGIAINPQTNLTYVTNYKNNNVSVIDEDNTVIATVPVDTIPVGVEVDVSRNRIYVACEGRDYLYVIDGAAHEVIDTIKVYDCWRIGVNSNSNLIYVSNIYWVQDIQVVDPILKKVIKRIPIESNANYIAVNPTTNRIYATLFNDKVVVLDGETNEVITYITVGKTPEGIAVNPSTNSVYVACRDDNSIYVIDGASNSVTRTIPSGENPIGIAVNPSTNEIYVANYGSHDVWIIPCETVTVSGMVKDYITGEPIAEARIFTYPPIAEPTITDLNGEFVLPDAPPAVVYAVKDGYYVSLAIPVGDEANIQLRPIITFDINPFIYGQNYWAWPNGGHDKLWEVKDLVRCSGIKILRFGGTFVDGVDNPNGFTDNDLDRFLEFCQIIGAEPLVQVSLVRWKDEIDPCATAAAESARLVRKYESRVNYWAIGNEPDIYDSEGWWPGYTKEKYSAHFKQIYNAMKIEDPSIIIMGPELAWDYQSAPDDGYEDFAESFLSKCADLVDIFSIHYWPFYDDQKPTAEEVLNNPPEIERRINIVKENIARIAKRQIPIAVTEWNLHANWELDWPYHPQSFVAGMWASDVLGRLIQNQVAISCFWSIREDGKLGYIDYLTGKPVPSYWALQLYANFKETLISCNSDHPDDFVVYGSRDSKTGDVVLMAVNKKPSESYEEEIVCDGINITYTFPPYTITCLIISHDGKLFSWEYSQEYTAPRPSNYGDVSRDGTISAYDAALVLQHAVGLIQLCISEQIVADVSGKNGVTAYDASLILQYVVGKIKTFPVEIQDAPTAIANSRSYQMTIDSLTAKPDERLVVSIKIDDATDIFSGGITLSYDEKILKLIEVKKTVLTSGCVMFQKISDGQVNISFASAEPLHGKGSLSYVTFEVLRGFDKAASLLILSQVNLNEGVLVTKRNGRLEQFPTYTQLLPNYPNPFNPETWIPFNLAKEAKVTINIYNVQGQLIRSLTLGTMPAGAYVVKERAAYWDGRNNKGERVASGMYFYTLQAGKFTAMRKMVIVK
jgi:YVTN family beta-propeller protein